MKLSYLMLLLTACLASGGKVKDDPKGLSQERFDALHDFLQDLDTMPTPKKADAEPASSAPPAVAPVELPRPKRQTELAVDQSWHAPSLAVEQVQPKKTTEVNEKAAASTASSSPEVTFSEPEMTVGDVSVSVSEVPQAAPEKAAEAAPKQAAEPAPVQKSEEVTPKSVEAPTVEAAAESVEAHSEDGTPKAKVSVAEVTEGDNDVAASKEQKEEVTKEDAAAIADMARQESQKDYQSTVSKLTSAAALRGSKDFSAIAVQHHVDLASDPEVMSLEAEADRLEMQLREAKATLQSVQGQLTA